MDRRRLLLGDWNRWIRDPIDVLRALLVAGAVGFAVAGEGRGALILALAGAAAFYIVLARRDAAPARGDETHARHYVGMGILTFALGGAIGAVWEIVEWSSDNVFGSELQESNDDTVYDLMADSAGALCGAALLVGWARFSWGSVRRIPGENRYEAVEG
jgi:hypothetical protein